jgi:hypothetical protein
MHDVLNYRKVQENLRENKRKDIKGEESSECDSGIEYSIKWM